MDRFINPPEYLEAQQKKRDDEAQRRSASASPSSRERDVLGFLLDARAARALGARRPRDHPRRGLLLRAAEPDEDHERGLGLVLALEDHDREGA